LTKTIVKKIKFYPNNLKDKIPKMMKIRILYFKKQIKWLKMIKISQYYFILNGNV
jgi:hypothetical protein